MKKLIYYFCLFLLSTSFATTSYSQTLIMNEVSNGPAGNQEYVEFVVSDTVVSYNCNSLTPPCIDIRGWIFDDNSGYHGAGGVAVGAVRFSFDPLWACVPLGTIIVIYNDADPNTSMPANDISLSDGNCSIIAPISNTALFEQNGTTPGAVACSYPATGWVAGGAWSTTLLANTGDCARIVNLAGCEVFSVCWAAANLNGLIYFSSGGSGSQNVWYFNNGNPNSQANWTEGSTTPAGGSQTPGLPNNPANAAYIAQFNNACSPITPLNVTATVTNAGCTCDGTATATATGSIPGYTYEWFNATFVPIGQTSATASGLCGGTYNVIATSSIGCVDTASVIITSSGAASVTVNNAVICSGMGTALTATPLTLGGTFSWSPSGQTTQTILITPTVTTTYTVIYTLAGCSATNVGIVTVNPLPIIAVPDQTVCDGTAITLSGNGANTYTWTGGITNGVAFAPLATTTYTVTGTITATGCTNTYTATITVNPLPTVGAGVDQTVCAGVAVTLSGSGASTYTWNNGVTNGVAFTPAATATYTVTGTSAAGCINTDQVIVTVNPNPVPVINGPSTYCTGNFALLSTSTPFTTYAWSTGAATPTINATIANNPISVVVTNAFGCSGTSPVFPIAENNVITANFNVTICQGQSSVIHGIAQTVAGVYSQTFTLGTGCDSTSNVTLVVNPLPVVNAGVDQAVCTGVATTLTATGAATYTWNNGVTNGVPFTQAIGAVTYTATGTSTAGCVNTDQVVVTVNPLPIVGAGVDQVVCAGTAVTLAGSGASTYTWNNGVTNGVAFTPIATNTYTVTGTDVNGCINTDQVLVTVNPIPVVFAGNDLVLCEGTTATLNATGATTYTWDNGAVNGVVFIPSLGNTTYTVTGTTAAGCIDTDQIDINVASITPVTFIPSLTYGCAPLTVTFTSTTIGASSYTWTMSNGTVITGSETVNNTFEEPGCYDISLSITNANGCQSTFSAIDLVCVDDSPIAAFTQSTFTVSEFNPTVIFDNNSIGASTYLWDFGDGSTTSNQTNPAYDYLNVAFGTSEITLVAISSFGCTDTAYSFIQINEELIFYVPNTFTPDDDMFNQTFQPIFTSGYDPYDFTLLIFNRWGEIVFESHNTEIGWNGTYGSNSNQGLVQDGTYTWKIEFKTNRNDERKMIVGHVNLVR